MPRERVEEATARLLELFPEGFEEDLQSEQDVKLIAYTDQGGLERLRETFGEVAAEPAVQGWDEEWKRFHVPAIVGRLWIGPPWAEAPGDLTPVVIDPGRAFGTGSHPTTQLCLELLLELEPASLLDVGCGSGVLAIAAARLGFAPVVGVDRDEAAVEATERNAARNGVALEVRQVDVLAEALPAAEVAVANIDLDALTGLLRRLECRHAVTSGYYGSDVLRAAGFAHRERRTHDRWAADLFERE